MKPTDLDDTTPVEPDDATLTRVRARSGSFRRRRNAQRVVTAVSGALVVVLAVAISFARVHSDASRPAGRTTPTSPTVTVAALGGAWSPVTIANYGGPLTAPPLPSVPRLSFQADDTFAGSDGCNDVSGTYRLGDDGSFDVRNLFSTANDCPQNVPLLDVLDAATRVTVSDPRLELFAADGHELAIFNPASITARLELPSDTIAAGTSVTAVIIVQNDTAQPVHVSGCVSYFEVLLVNDDVHQQPNWLECRQPFTFPVGTSRQSIQVSASYNSCTAVSVHGPTADQFPSCLPDKNPPPLPPGDYQATLFQTGDAVFIAPPRTVHVVDQGDNAQDFAAADLERALAHAGYRVTPDGTTPGGVLAAPTQLLCASGTQVRVQEYAEEAARRAVSDGINADGYGFVDGNRHTVVDWIGPPHFFARGRLLVLVLQDDRPLLGALTRIMGPTISPDAPPNARAKAACT